MKSLLLRLYPAPWRHRYGEEFAQLLEDSRLAPFDVLDVMLGAADARVRAVSTRFGGLGDPATRSLRIAGAAAVIGGVAWLIALTVLFGIAPLAGPEALAFVLVAFGSGSLLVALVGLTAVEAREDRVVAWLAAGVPAIGSVATTAGVLVMVVTGGAAELWYGIFIVGLYALVAGSGFFALVASGTRAVGRRTARFLAAASAVFVVAIAVGLSAPDLLGIAWVGFSLAWVVVGIEALRRDQPADEPGPQPAP